MFICTISNQHSTARTPLPFSFSFPLFSLPFFFLRFFFPLLFVVLRVPFLVPFFSFLSSFRLIDFLLILVSPSSLLLSLPAFLCGGFCFSVIRLGATPPPRSFRARSLRIPRACCLLSSFLHCYCWLIFIFFFSSFPFRVRFGHRLFLSCLFLVGTVVATV